MSFILDALKKAEAERQRQTGPTLLEVRVAQPRRRFPLWTLVIGALLIINILVLLAFVLRRPAPATEPTPTPTPTPAPAPTAAAISPPAPAAVPVAPPAASAPAAPAQAAPAGPAAGAVAPRAPLAASDDAQLAGDNPADFEPAVPATATRAPPFSVRRTEPPSLSDSGGELPDLRLDLHVYATRPADRYALINMHRVREGDVLPEGPRVVAIDPDGVELSYRGTEFMLHPQ
jgi:general secretion pathway protein B